MRRQVPSYNGFPPEIISHAVWLYRRCFRHSASLLWSAQVERRGIEDPFAVNLQRMGIERDSLQPRPGAVNEMTGRDVAGAASSPQDDRLLARL